MPRFGFHHSAETKVRMSSAQTGHRCSKETKKKMSKANKGFKKGHIPWIKGLTKETNEKVKKMAAAQRGNKRGLGRRRSKEQKKRYSEGRKRFYVLNPDARPRGNKNPNWKGGLFLRPYFTDWTETLKRSIRERDHYTCRICWNYGDNVHHADYRKENNNPGNLFNLCSFCHGKTNFNRREWKRFFIQGDLLK